MVEQAGTTRKRALKREKLSIVRLLQKQRIVKL